MAVLRGAIASMAPSLTGISVRASRIHADNIWLSSRLRILDFYVAHYGKRAFTHVRAAHQ